MGDRGGTATATKIEGSTIGFPTRMVAGLPTDQLPNTPLPPNQGGVTVTGPGLVVSNSSPFPRVLTHGGVVYREGTTISKHQTRTHQSTADSGHSPVLQLPQVDCLGPDLHHGCRHHPRWPCCSQHAAASVFRTYRPESGSWSPRLWRTAKCTICASE